MIVDSSIPGWLHVGTRAHWVGRLLVLWMLEFWLRTSRRVDTTMEQVSPAAVELSTASDTATVDDVGKSVSKLSREKMRYKLNCRTCWNAGTGMLQMLR